MATTSTSYLNALLLLQKSCLVRRLKRPGPWLLVISQRKPSGWWQKSKAGTGGISTSQRVILRRVSGTQKAFIPSHAFADLEPAIHRLSGTSDDEQWNFKLTFVVDVFKAHRYNFLSETYQMHRVPLVIPDLEQQFGYQVLCTFVLFR